MTVRLKVATSVRRARGRVPPVDIIPPAHKRSLNADIDIDVNVVPGSRRLLMVSLNFIHNDLNAHS